MHQRLRQPDPLQHSLRIGAHGAIRMTRQSDRAEYVLDPRR
jgi:hypothetical protein